jgi:hypothetical protein
MSPSSSRPIVLGLVVLGALLACKKKQEQTAPSATPPPASVAPTAEPTATASAEPSSAQPDPAKTTTIRKPNGDAGAKDAAPSDAAAKNDAAATSDAGGTKNAACQSKCQGVMQACLTPSGKDGGLPSFADPTQCKAAFDECVKACK